MCMQYVDPTFTISLKMNSELNKLMKIFVAIKEMKNFRKCLIVCPMVNLCGSLGFGTRTQDSRFHSDSFEILSQVSIHEESDWQVGCQKIAFLATSDSR